MKKIISFICMTMILLSMSMTALAGSIPEDLLHSDDAQIFFAEVVAYHPDKENPDIALVPTKVIKGDVKTGAKLWYYNPNTVGDFKVKTGKTYLFTYFDENNPTDIFEVTSYDTDTLKLKNVEGDMWERFQKYLNEGRYLDAEHERIDRQNADIPVVGENIALTELIGVSKDEAETIKIHYGRSVFDADIDKFYKAADSIILTDIEDVSLEKVNGENVSLPSGMYITVNGFDGYAFITDDCKVDKYGMHHSDIPNGEYTMKSADFAKLKYFTATEEENKVPFLETELAKDIFYEVIIVIICCGIAGIIIYAVRKKKKSK